MADAAAKAPRWDYDGKEFYLVSDGVRRRYRVPDDVRDEIRAACPGLVTDLDMAGPILLKAQSEGRLVPVPW